MTDPVKVAPRVEMFAEVVGRGKPMVLVHGFGLDHRMWKYQIPYLKNHGYHVVAIDLRGFGDSKGMPASYTYDTWANDLGKAINKFERRDVTLVGFSLGGAIAMHYMATHDNPPVKRLVLVAAAGPYMTWRWEDVLDRGTSFLRDFLCDPFTALVDTVESFTTGHWDNIVDHWACVGRDPLFFDIFDALIDLINTRAFYQLITQIYGDEVLTAEAADFQWIQDMLQSSSPEALIGGLEEMRDQDLQESLEDIAIPTTIVGGMADLLVPPGLIAEQYMLIEDAECSMLPGGHGLFFEQMDGLNRALAGR